MSIYKHLHVSMRTRLNRTARNNFTPKQDNLFHDIDIFNDIPKNYTQIACIHNLVGTSRINSALECLNLTIICKMLPNSYFEKQKFAAITIRLAQPFCTVLLFTSGKMVLTGCKSYMDCLLAALTIKIKLQAIFLGLEFSLERISIQNIVGNASLNLHSNQTLNLSQFYQDHNILCTYQPNMFPGLIYRPSHVNIVLLLFYSGKIVITGAKNMYDVYTGWKLLHDMVIKYIKRPAEESSVSQ